VNPFPNALGSKAIEFYDHPATSVWPTNFPYADDTFNQNRTFKIGVIGFTHIRELEKNGRREKRF
jgi:hypothetical protein